MPRVYIIDVLRLKYRYLFSIIWDTFMKRVLVNLPDKVVEIIQKELKGKMGDNNSEVLRSIIVSYLSEKGYMNKELNQGGRR